MENRFTRDFWLRLIILALFVFALYSNVQLIIRNHALSQVLTAKKAETAKQAFDNQKLKLLLAYYQTPSYQEVEAMRRLQLKKPDETVYIVKGLSDTPASLASALSDDISPITEPAAAKPKTNIQLWWEYFFK